MIRKSVVIAAALLAVTAALVASSATSAADEIQISIGQSHLKVLHVGKAGLFQFVPQFYTVDSSGQKTPVTVPTIKMVVVAPTVLKADVRDSFTIKLGSGRQIHPKKYKNRLTWNVPGATTSHEFFVSYIPKRTVKRVCVSGTVTADGVSKSLKLCSRVKR